MRKIHLSQLSLFVVLALSATAQAAPVFEIKNATPEATVPDSVDKSALAIANLEVVFFSGPITARQGENIVDLVFIEVRNTGPEAITTRFNINVALSDTIGGRGTGDINIGGRTMNGGIAVGDSILDLTQILIPADYPLGDHYLVLKLDSFNVIAETNENDNRASVPIAITTGTHYSAYYEDFQAGPAGWVAQDLTAQADVFMHRVVYSDGIDNLGVWWCGANNPAWSGGGGYGNNWDQRLEKDFVLPFDATILSYNIQFDTEPTFDFVRVDISSTGGITYKSLAVYDGSTDGVFQFFSHDISQFAGQAVRIRFRFTSDGGFSDEDGIHPTNGAFRLDDVSVSGNGTDDFEIDGNGWLGSPAPPLGGEFRLVDTAFCPPGFNCDEFGNGTPGIFCNSWVAYETDTNNFPSTSPVDNEAGLRVRLAFDSPSIAIPALGLNDAMRLTLNVFSDLPIINGVFYVWYVRDNLNSTWRSHNFIYFGEGGWREVNFDITELVTDGATSMQIRLGAVEEFYFQPNHNSAPYFDNVGIVIFNQTATPETDPAPRVCGWSDADTDGDGVTNDLDLCNGETASFFDRDGDGCLDAVIGGRHIEYWDEGAFPLTYFIHEAGAPGITDGSDTTAIKAGFDAWTTVAGAEISFRFGGTIADGDAKALDLINTVTFADPDFAFPSGVLAVGLSTSYVTPVLGAENIRPGQIIDTDMIFNPTAAFRTNSQGTGTHMQGVVSHEAGHMLGVSHSAVRTSTMFYVLPPFNEAVPLAPEDVQAMLKSYPDSTLLADANHLSGTVTDGYTGDPVAGAIVFAIEALPGEALGDTIGCDYTLPADGSYHFLGLPVGDYYIAIHPLNGSAAIGFIQPGNINQLILTSAETVFLPEFYDASESSDDELTARTSVNVGAGTFTTANLVTNVDQTPPSVLLTSPAHNDVDVAVNSALLIKFSEPMAPDSFQGNFAFSPLAGGATVQGNAALASDDSTLMYIPTDHLAFDTQYQVQILGGVRDLFNNVMGDPVQITFTTEVQPPVFVDNLVPSKAIAGSHVIVNGAGFSADVAGNSVTFAGVAAHIIEATTDHISVVVPDGLTLGPVEVIVTNPLLGFATTGFNLLAAEEVARGHEVATVDLPSLPDQVAVSPDGDFAYVATASGLAVIDVTERANPVLYFMDDTDGLDDVGVTPGGGNIFAASAAGQKFLRYHFDRTLIGTATNPVSLVSEIDLGESPLGLMVGPSGRRAYIAVADGTIQVWDTDETSTTHERQVGIFALADPNLLGNMALDPSGDRLFALTGTGQLKVFDIKTLSLVGDVTVQANPVDVAIAPAGQYAFITDATGYLTIVSLATLQTETDINTGGDLRGAAVTPAGSFIYAANYESDNLDVIDLRPSAPTFRNVVTRIPARINPLDLVFSPDGSYAYSLVEDERKFVISAMGAGPILNSVSPAAGPVGARVVLAGSGFTGATVTVNGIGATIERSTDTAMTVVIPAGAMSGPITVVGAVPGEVSNSLTFPVLESAPEGSLRLAAALHPGGLTEIGSVMAVSPIGGQITVSGMTGDVLLLDTRPASTTYHQFTTVSNVHTAAITALTFSPDGASVYAMAPGLADLVIIDAAFGNTTYGQIIRTVPVAATSPGGMVVSPDGSRILIADPGAGGVWIVDPVTSTASLALVSQGGVAAMAFHPAGAYAYLGVDTAGLAVLDLSDPATAEYGTVIGPGISLAEVPLSLAFTPDGTQCYLLTSTLVNRAVVRVNTSTPTAPSDTTTVGLLPTLVAPGPESLVLSPVGDRSVVNVTSEGLYQALLDPWTAGAVPEVVLSATELGLGYGHEGRKFYAADPVSDQIMEFDFLGVQQMVAVWGADQTGAVAETLPTPLRIRIVDQIREGSAGVPVTFTVGLGGGHFTVAGESTTPTTLTLATDAFGYAQVNWVLGATPGDQSVAVVSEGVSGSPTAFSAVAITDPKSLPLEVVTALLAPTDGATGVSVTTAIQAVFTKSLDPLTIFEDSYFLWNLTDGVLVPVVYGFADLDRRVSLTPVSALDFDKIYQVTLGATIKDPAGGALINPLVFSFTTEPAPAAPSLVAVNPPSAAALVHLVLSGTGFDPIPANNTVRFTSADDGSFVDGFVSDAATDFIRTSVPLTAETGTITVIGTSPTDALPFTVLVPTTASADDVIASIGTGSGTKSVTVSPDGAVAYAVSPEADLLIPMDLETLASLPSIPVGDEPWAVAVHPAGTFIYVANRMSGDVSVVDIDPLSPTWHQVQAFVPVGLFPVDLIVNPTGDRVFVANSQSNSLSVIDANESSATFSSVIASVPIGSPAKSVTVSPDGSRVYIGTDDGYLTLESLEYGVIASVKTGTGTKSVTVSPDGALLIVLNTQGEVSVFDVAPGSESENQVIAKIGSGAVIKSATVSPDGALLMVVREAGDVIDVYALDVGTSVSALEPGAAGLVVDLLLLATLEAGENPQVIAFDPTGNGQFVVTNAGDNTLTVFGIVEEIAPGWLSNLIFADCPDPGTPLHGVEIDVYANDTGAMVASRSSDESGLVELELAQGMYNVTLVTPLGYFIDNEVVPLEIVSADTVSLDWSLFCQKIVPKPRRMSFWKHQLGVALRGEGNFDIDGATLCSYLDLISVHFNNHRLNQVVVYLPPESDECVDKLRVAKDLLNLDGDEDMLAHARQELLALLFNVSAGKLSLTEIISFDGAPVSRAITYVDQLVDDGNPNNDELAMKIAKDINRGKPVKFGVIPDGVPNFSYRNVPRKFSLSAVYPNPFNPTTTIKFEVAKPEHVKLLIYDVAGRLVRTLVDEPKAPNRYVVVWDGANDQGARLASGVYFYRMLTASFEKTRKMVMLK